MNSRRPAGGSKMKKQFLPVFKRCQRNKSTLSKVENADRLQYEKRLWKLSKKGDIDTSFRILNEMIAENIELTHYALSSMLHSCINNNVEIGQYEKVWTQFVTDQRVEPDIGCYNLLIKAASQCQDSYNLNRYGNEMKTKFPFEMNTRKWNGLIAAFARLNDINAMFNEYHAMKRANISPDCYTMSILINAVLKGIVFIFMSGEITRKFRSHNCYINTHKLAANFNRFDELLTEIMDSKLIDVYVFGGILDGLIKNGKATEVEAIWDKIIIEYGIKPNILCYSFAIMASYQSDKYAMFESLIDELKSRNYADPDFKIDKFCWQQILTGHGHFGEFDKMWDEYYNMIENRHNKKADIGSLSILTTFEKRNEYLHKALNEVIKYVEEFDGWDAMKYDRKKHFYRIACIADHFELQSILWPLLESTDDVVQVYATFDHDGEHFVLNNTYGDDADIYREYAHKLIEKVGYEVDACKHPEIRTLNDNYDLSDDYAKQMLSYHAEKRALGYLIETESKDIEINVSMRMCYDCHRFFCAVSKYHPDKCIICIDPNKKHVFVKGACSCGKV